MGKRSGVGVFFGILMFIAAAITLFSDAEVKFLPIAFFIFFGFLLISPNKDRESKKVEDESKPVAAESFPEKVPKKTRKSKEPEYEIKYVDGEGEETTRQIAYKNFDGIILTAFCFLRNEERSFYINRILECVDLSTGEVVGGDLRAFFASKYTLDAIPYEMYRKDVWMDMPYVNVPDMPQEMSFDLNESLNMTIVTYSGVKKDNFFCYQIGPSTHESDKYFIRLKDSSGYVFTIGFSKILKADGVDNFFDYVVEKFYQSDEGRVEKLLDERWLELSILAYLGRADSSLTAKKRKFIFDYLKQVGTETDDNILSTACRRLSPDLPSFKKSVNSYAKTIPADKKQAFLFAAESVIGGREKAKPFGLAGFQYIESKIKV